MERRFGQLALGNLLAGLVYYAAGAFGLSLASIHPSASAVWPATGVAIGLLTLGGSRLAPGVFLAAFAVNLPSAGAWALLIGAGNLGEGLVAALLIRHFVGRTGLVQVYGVLKMTGAVAVAGVVSASLGILALLGAGSLAFAAAGSVWLTWWLGDIMGGLLVAPAILLAVMHREDVLDRAREATLIGALLLAVAAGSFFVPRGGTPLAFLPLPMLILLAIRCGPAAAALGSLALGGLTWAAQLTNHGPFADLPLELGLLTMQGFLASAALTALFVAAGAHTRAVTAESLRAANEDLEATVAKRTAAQARTVEALRREAEDRQKADDAERVTRSHLAVAQRIANVGSWEWHVASDRVTWSDQLYRIYGHEGKPDVDFASFLAQVHPDDRGMVEKTVGASVKTHRPFRFEHRIIRPDGSERTLRAEGLVEVVGGVVQRMRGTGQDVTDRAQEERTLRAAEAARTEVERLRQLDEFKSAFLNMAAHELSTPMTPLRLQLHMLRRRAAPEDARPLEVMERNLERLGGLVDDLLESARIQSGRLPVNVSRTNIRALVAETLETFEKAAAHNQVTLINDMPAATPVVDAEHVGHILYNLVSNAVKFTSGGTVTVRGKCDDKLCLEVQDEGIGLEPDQIAQLFQPFQRVHDAALGVPGTGLGLSICKGLVEAQGGTIEVISEGAGTGTTFRVEIPSQRQRRSTRGPRPPRDGQIKP